MKDLKVRYWFINLLWYIFVKPVLKAVTYVVHNQRYLIAYPLMIDIELGQMKFYYFKYGFFAVVKRASNYPDVIIARAFGTEEYEDLSLEFLNEKAKLRVKLSEEVEELDREYNG